jgi:hypothetical protein
MPPKLLPPRSPLSAANVNTRILPVQMTTTGTSAFEVPVGDLQSTSKFDATRQIFSALLKARGESRDRLYEALLGFTEPEVLLHVALSEYEQHGNQERLALAASLLADMGSLVLPALQALVQSENPQCGMFIPVITHLRGVSSQKRLALLEKLTSNPDVYVRYSLLDEISSLPNDDARPLLQILSHDIDPDIAEQAQSYLNVLRP